jgi:2-dehydro-3-deoxygluconokinase
MTRGSETRTERNDVQLEVVCVGETMAMVTPEQPEPLEFAQTVVIHPAGAESNVAMYLASLGHRAGWVSRLGDDPLGRRVLRDVSAVGVDTSLVEIDENAPTGVFFKDPGLGRTRVFYYRRGSAASLMRAELLDPVLRMPPQLVHLTGITPALSQQCDDMMSQLFHAFRKSSTTISFDVNFRESLWPHAKAAMRLIELAQQADVVFVGLDEAQALWGPRKPDDLRTLIDQPRVLVVKNGAIGATVYHEEDSEFVPALKVDVREPVGAGDAFAAGWLSGLLRNLPHGQRLRLGHLLASDALSSTADHHAPKAKPCLHAALSVNEAEWVDVTLTPQSDNVGTGDVLENYPGI